MLAVHIKTVIHVNHVMTPARNEGVPGSNPGWGNIFRNKIQYLM